MSDTIHLDPDLFMALGLSAEANGGIGRAMFGTGRTPVCLRGHVNWIDSGQPEQMAHGPATDALERALPCGVVARNDGSLADAGVRVYDKVPFTEWCRIVCVDVAE